MNASFAGDRIRSTRTVHIGVAVAVEDGLITPVIRDADRKSLGRISAEARTLAERARDRRLQPDEYTGATFSISNLGMMGIDEFSAIINPPEAAILAVGAVREVPVVEDGQVKVGRRMKLTLSVDHRVADGAPGRAFPRHAAPHARESAAARIAGSRLKAQGSGRESPSAPTRSTPAFPAPAARHLMPVGYLPTPRRTGAGCLARPATGGKRFSVSSQPMLIDRIVLRPGPAVNNSVFGLFPKDIEIWTSMAATADGPFEKVATASLPPVNDQNGEATVSFSPVEARFLKFRALINQAGAAEFVASEIKVMEAQRPGYVPLMKRHPELHRPGGPNNLQAGPPTKDGPACAPATGVGRRARRARAPREPPGDPDNEGRGYAPCGSHVRKLAVRTGRRGCGAAPCRIRVGCEKDVEGLR